MRCSSCGSRTDPDRSFCRRCGSAVFMDDDTYVATRRLFVQDDGDALAALRSDRPSERRGIRRALPAAPPRPAAVAASGAGCLAAFIRWGIFAGIVYFVFSTVAQVPEVRQAFDTFLRGDAVDLRPAADAVRRRIGLPVSGPDPGAGTTGASGTSAPEPASDSAASPAPVPARPVYSTRDAGVTAPRALRRIAPKYPDEAIAQRLQGGVLLRCVVEADGAVSGVEVVRSIDPSGALDREAIAALQQWQFEPARLNGQPVAVSLNVPFNFTLREAPADAR
jgi:TonB family protein